MKVSQWCTALCLTMSGLLTSVTGYAQNLEIINHFGNKLNFNIIKGEQFVPNFSPIFSIEDGQSASTQVLKSGNECATSPYNPSAYIAVNDDLQDAVAFFGTGLMCQDDNLVEISGFMNNGIAYSWINGENAVLIFCKTSDYPCQS